MFIVCNLAESQLSKMLKNIGFFQVVMVALLFLITFVPQLVITIPNWFMGAP